MNVYSLNPTLFVIITKAILYIIAFFNNI